MVEIIENSKAKNLFSFSYEFIRIVGKLADAYEEQGRKLEKIVYDCDENGLKNIEYIWSIDLRLIGWA